MRSQAPPKRSEDSLALIEQILREWHRATPETRELVLRFLKERQ